MMRLSRLLPLIGLLLALASPADSQSGCGGQFSANRYCGTGASAGLPGPIANSSLISTVCTLSPTTCTAVFGYSNIRWYGADGNGVVDATPAIQLALNQATSGFGGAVFIPPGNYSITASSGCIFKVSNGFPFTIYGVGQPSNLIVKAGTANTVDALCVTPTFATGGIILRDFNINYATNDGTTGRHSIHFDTTTNNAAVLSNVLIDNVFIGNSSGNSIYAHGIVSATSGSINYSTIRNSFLQRPLSLLYAGDAVRVDNNTIFVAGTGDQLTATQLTGSAGLVIQNNVIAGPSGCITINSGPGAIVQNNECENTTGSGSAAGAMIDINGGTANVNNAKIIGNNITCTGACTATAEIRTATATNAVVDDNRIFNLSGSHFLNTAAAIGTFYGVGNQCTTNPGTIGCVFTDAKTDTTFGVFNGQSQVAQLGIPTIASGACGTGTNGSISGTNFSGVITIGASATATCTIGFSQTIPVPPTACLIFPGNAAAAATGTTVARVGAPSTTNWVIMGSALASTVYSYLCR
jgi:hypothetical protein